MTRDEDRIAARIDRDRDKAEASARTLRVRDIARTTINCAVMDAPEEDRAEFMRAAIRHLRTLYGAGEGEREAVSLFASLSWSATLQTRRAIAGAEADQAFARLTATNDGGQK